MPSGARSTEHGRPLMWPIIHSPTASKYWARSSLVTGSPAPPAGHKPLSRFEMAAPITSAGFFSDDLSNNSESLEVGGLGDFFFYGCSAVPPTAGLSSLQPLDA